MSGLPSRIKSFRLHLNLTQTEMAEIMGSSSRQYRRYESGEIPIPSDKLLPLVEQYHLNLNWLFTGEGSHQRMIPSEPVKGQDRSDRYLLIHQLLLEYQAKASGREAVDMVREPAEEYHPDSQEILQALLTLIRALK